MQDRIKKLRQVLLQQNLDALLVSNFYSILYLTGFKTLDPHAREAYTLITHKNVYLFSDGRYISNIKNKISNIKYSDEKLKVKYELIEAGRIFISLLAEIIQREKIKRIGFEAEDLKFTEYKHLAGDLNINGLLFYPTEKLVIKLREIKEQDEIEKIKKACEIGDQCLAEIVSLIKSGVTEKEISFKIEFWLKKKGYGLAFEPIVAVDENASLPHYNTQTGQGKVQKNSLILIDFGVCYQDYCSDITRMLFAGRPSDQIQKTYSQLLAIQSKTIQKAISTSDPKAVDQYCRDLYLSAGFPSFPHSTGHGIGLEVHEFPKISMNSDDILQNSQVFSIEPGLYLPGKFGIRIEDLVWKKKEGGEVLTKFGKSVISV